MITQAELREVLRYEPETGNFIWAAPKRGVRLGSIAGYKRKNHQYVVIGLNQTHYLAHQLAWLYCYGSVPSLDIDHINGNKQDNRIINLRIVSRSENNQNRRFPNKNNKLGLKGIYRIKSGKYRVVIGLDDKNIHLGYYKNLEDAIGARRRGEILHHPCSHVNYDRITPYSG